MARDTDLIAAIYDAVIDPSRWDDVVKRIVEETKSVSGCILTNQVGTVHLTALCNIDPIYADAYIQTYFFARLQNANY